MKKAKKRTKKNISIPLDPVAMENLYHISHNVMDAMYFRGIKHPTIKAKKGKKKK